MPASINQLLKIIQLEGKQFNFSNHAVIGGFQKYIPSWFQEAQSEALPEEVTAAINEAFSDYETASDQQRSQSISVMLKKLKAIYPGDPNIAQTLQMMLPYFHYAKSEEVSLTVEKPKPTAPAAVPSAKPVQTPTAAHAVPASPVQPASPSPSAPASISSAPPAPAGPSVGMNAPLTVLSGVGKSMSEKYESVGVRTLGDLLYYFPRRYDDYSQLKPINRLQYGDELTIIATVQSSMTTQVKSRNMSRVEVIVSDGTGFLRLVFWRRGDTAQYLENRLKRGTQLVISGKVDMYLGRLQISNPDFEPLEKTHLSTNGIIPVYPLTAGLSQTEIRRDIHQVINFYCNRVVDFMPSEVKRAANIIDLPVALHQVHYPSSHDLLNSARERLSFDEIFLLQLGVLQQKQNWHSASARKYTISDDALAGLVTHLPFALTNAQQKVLGEIRQDLDSGSPMNRLLQGDVGSGKTVIAALAANIIALAGAQSAIMAPTSILAEQHYQTLQKLSAAMDESAPLRPENIRLLTGDTSPADREEIRTGLEDGSIKLLIGTHALIEDPVKFKDLQLVVIDEQHRFGIAQRSALRQKGESPHLLVMTATPIPRSLALTLYGDLDLSIIDEMPAGRQPVETHVLPPVERERAYQMIQSQVNGGSQAFIVYPLIEASENNEEVKAAVDEHEMLQRDVFPNLKLGLLHGRMKPDEKEAVMRRFRDREFQILVSTTVIEVGVDVPNATVMLIEGANRFGLAQLHQLRGRVGRGSAQAFCLLIPDREDAVENERLMVMTQTNDGFVLAEKDLQQRGPGDFIGDRQSGFNELKLASIMDIKTIEKSRSLAQDLFARDPDLSAPENELLKGKLAEFWTETTSDLS
jgi:ATP-dependent DNA helicase RecG